MPVTILHDKQGITRAELNELARHVGWGDAYYPLEAQWQRVLAASTYIAYARDEQGALVCFGRILEDGKMCMFYDVCVRPDYQGRKVGSKLMNTLIDIVKDKQYASIGLLVETDNPSAFHFYQKLGFEAAPAMELKKYMWDP